MNLVDPLYTLTPFDDDPVVRGFWREGDDWCTANDKKMAWIVDLGIPPVRPAIIRSPLPSRGVRDPISALPDSAWRTPPLQLADLVLPQICECCRGGGRHDGTVTCDVCGGHGAIHSGVTRKRWPCPSCTGSGTIQVGPPGSCAHCGGTGRRIRSSLTFEPHLSHPVAVAGGMWVHAIWLAQFLAIPGVRWAHRPLLPKEEKVGIAWHWEIPWDRKTYRAFGLLMGIINPGRPSGGPESWFVNPQQQIEFGP